jgi:hypothetical protein
VRRVGGGGVWDAEKFGQYWGGHLAGELEECGFA